MSVEIIMSDGNGWPEYRKFVVATLEENKAAVASLDRRVRNVEIRVAVILVALETIRYFFLAGGPQ